MSYDPTDWDTADETAKTTAQHFFTDPNGAHVTETAGNPNAGNNVLIDSGGMYVRDGTTNLAQFTDPTIVGETGAGKMNIRIGNIPNWDNGLAIFKGNSLSLMMYGDSSTGTIYSALGCYLNFTDGLSCTVFGKTPLTILDSNRQSGFCIGGYHVYAGTTVLTVGAARTITVFSVNDFASTFNVANTSDNNKCYVNFVNGDYGANAHHVISTQYGSGSGWSMYLDANASAGSFRVNYVVAVPDAYSSV